MSTGTLANWSVDDPAGNRPTRSRFSTVAASGSRMSPRRGGLMSLRASGASARGSVCRERRAKTRQHNEQGRSQVSFRGAGPRAMSPSQERAMRGILSLFVVGAVLAATPAGAQEIDWSKVDAAFGRKAAVTGDVHRYGFPRSDLKVTLDGVEIKPAFALGGWVAMKPAHGGAMVMGDLVLLESEIAPVMTTLIQNGLEITAVHNHVLRANPATFYMHVGGHGDPAKIATTILQALQSSRTPLTPPAAPASQPAIELDTAQLDQII